MCDILSTAVARWSGRSEIQCQKRKHSSKLEGVKRPKNVFYLQMNLHSLSRHHRDRMTLHTVAQQTQMSDYTDSLHVYTLHIVVTMHCAVLISVSSCELNTIKYIYM